MRFLAALFCGNAYEDEGRIDVDDLREQLLGDLAKAATAEEVAAIRTRYIGSKGTITLLGKNTDFGKMSAEQKREFGAKFNALKQFAADAVNQAAERAAAGAAGAGARKATVDLTLPGTERMVGALHPITLVQQELEEIFHGMGFMTLAGYEVEEEYYNFDALNIPGDHPAREMQDTFWLDNGLLLRIHTSAPQARALPHYGAPRRARFPC